MDRTGQEPTTANGQPKYVQVREWIRGLVREGRLRPGDRAPSENDLAARFGISRNTARQALSDLTHDGLLERTRGSGTYVRTPARTRGSKGGAAAPSRSTGRIGVLISHLDHYIFTDILQGIDGRLQQAGLGLVMASSGNSTSREARCLQTLQDQGMDGLVLEPARSALPGGNRSAIAHLAERMPVVFIHGDLPDVAASCVRPDDEGGMDRLVRHLHGLGHRRIGGLFKRDDIQGCRRREGFRRAIAALGLPEGEDGAGLLLWFDTGDLRDPDALADRTADRWLACPPDRRPTALCCYNDQVGVRLAEAMGRKGVRIPEDLSLTGFDGSDLARLSAWYGPGPGVAGASGTAGADRDGGLGGLTTVTHPRRRLGVRAVELLLERLRDPSASPRELVMPARLIPGRSTGPPPG